MISAAGHPKTSTPWNATGHAPRSSTGRRDSEMIDRPPPSEADKVIEHPGKSKPTAQSVPQTKASDSAACGARTRRAYCSDMPKTSSGSGPGSRTPVAGSKSMVMPPWWQPRSPPGHCRLSCPAQRDPSASVWPPRRTLQQTGSTSRLRRVTACMSRLVWVRKIGPDRFDAGLRHGSPAAPGVIAHGRPDPT